MGFSFRRDRWLEWLGHIDEAAALLRDLPPELDRATVKDIVSSSWEQNPAGAFVATMVWGHGHSGYGPYRVARILTLDANPREAPINQATVSKLLTSGQKAQAEGPVSSYYFLNNEGRIWGLGPAFFTKWLFFVGASSRVSETVAAPILDQLILTWLRDEGFPLRPGRTPDYERYVNLLTEWGEPHGLAPADVEERIFRIIRNDGASGTLPA